MIISIVIPTKERGEILERTLKAATQATQHIDAEILVVNDSKISTPVIPSQLTNVMLFEGPKSGVAAARNFGASLAKSELILFIDDDFLINKESIDISLELFKEEPRKIHLFNWSYPPYLYPMLRETQFGRYLITFGFDSLKGWLGEEWNESEDIFELKHGASYYLPIARTIFMNIGGYNEKFPHAGAEDYDFIMRAKDTGVRFFLNKTCLLYHDESDRTELKPWLKRKKRNGETLRVAAGLGYRELALHYSTGKRLILETLSLFKPITFLLLTSIPNRNIFDVLYFKIVNALLAVYVYEGYYKRE